MRPTLSARYPHPAHAAIDAEPIGGINTTPLIDVMLVLLVMFIITIPITTNEIPIELPQPAPDSRLPITQHRLVLTARGATVLDGVEVDGTTLRVKLAKVRADPQSSLILNTDGNTPYVRFVDTLAVVKRAGITRLGFEGNARFAE